MHGPFSKILGAPLHRPQDRRPWWEIRLCQKCTKNALFPHKKIKKFCAPPQTHPHWGEGHPSPDRTPLGAAASTPSASRPYPTPYSEILHPPLISLIRIGDIVALPFSRLSCR